MQMFRVQGAGVIHRFYEAGGPPSCGSLAQVCRPLQAIVLSGDLMPYLATRGHNHLQLCGVVPDKPGDGSDAVRMLFPPFGSAFGT